MPVPCDTRDVHQSDSGTDATELYSYPSTSATHSPAADDGDDEQSDEAAANSIIAGTRAHGSYFISS